MLSVLDADKDKRELLLKEFASQIPDAILVSTNCGFGILEHVLASEQAVIAYGSKEDLGDSRYRTPFTTRKRYGCVFFPEAEKDGLRAFVSVYRHIMEYPAQMVARIIEEIGRAHV